MSWDMRARAENQAQWSTFRRQFETGRPSDRIADNEAGVAEGQHSLTEALATDGSVVVVASGDGDSEVTQNEFVEEAATEEEQDGPGNYYFRQVLDHFSGSNNLAVPKSSPLQSLLGSSNNNNTFRQYYYINSEFYKPGGPIILWIPGESPLHTLFLRRGLAYELANATSGLLVALEHRFYGSSIPRFQDSSTAANNIISDHKVRQETENNIGSRRSVWGSSSVARTHPRTTSARASDTEIKGDGDGSDGSADNTSMRNSSKGHGNKGNQEEMEGLPLDLLKYLTVDQTIEDIASFIDHFSILQPSFYPADEEDTAEMRWILAGCSQASFTSSQTIKEVKREAREAAKLEVLNWFSPDFAHDYAQEGEEVHAAGWIWWTVASAVQYNGIVTPPTVEPAKTAIDILCETMAKTDSQDLNEWPFGSLFMLKGDALLESARYAKALAMWFRDMQYFTPTRIGDLQPPDLDPNSMQNLASMAWLWQTCSELGYLQTSRPSSCCCPSASAPKSPAKNSVKFRDNSNTSPSEDLASTSNATCLVSDWTSLHETMSLLSRSVPSTSCCRGVAPNPPSNASSCLACRCHATKSQVKESVFSRLLTLEAAWQECQFYFGMTHSDSKESMNTSNKQTKSQRSLQHRVGGKHRVPRGDQHGSGGDNGSPGRSRSKLRLLHEYPDVDQNVNMKFHGWEIATEPSSGTSDEEIERSRNARPEQAGHIIDTAIVAGVPSATPDCRFMGHTNRSTSGSREDFDILRPDHAGSGGVGRYYFTNGENDPWKELTLASHLALEFLKQEDDRRKMVSVSTPSTLNPLPIVDSTQLNRKPTIPTLATASADLSSATAIPMHPPGIVFRNSTGKAPSGPSKIYPIQSRPRPRDQKHHRLRRRGRGKDSPSLNPNLQNGANEDGDDDEEKSSTRSTLQSHDRHNLPMGQGTEKDTNNRGEDKSERKTILRIIPGASHCQDILYQSSDLESVELREERQHVLKTFVHWIEQDVQRLQLIRKQEQRFTKGINSQNSECRI
ncbi:hypothetical protein BGZ54_006800 [Gamsiella multidivaricata]|nr:hypothetical protein BGZ54_006800 [Gamsiella multidivaricata]